MESKHFVKDHPNHHHVHASVGLIRVGHLACVLQRVHEGFELHIAPFERIGQPSLGALNEQLPPYEDLPLFQILYDLQKHSQYLK